MVLLYLVALDSSKDKTILKALNNQQNKKQTWWIYTASWELSPFIGMLEYFAKHVSGYDAHKTAISVHVIHNKPPLATVCTAVSIKGAAEPYGSKSTTLISWPWDFKMNKEALW